MTVKGTNTVRTETDSIIKTNTAKNISGDKVQIQIVDALDSLSQDLYDDTIPYEAGESVIFESGGVKRNYLCLAGTTPAESPTTTPAKWEVVGGVSTGVMQVAKAEVLHTNTAQTTIITLPANAVLWDIGLEVTEIFNDSGTDQLALGIVASGGLFQSSVDVSNLNFYNNVTFDTWSSVPWKSDETGITFQYTGQNADASQGTAYVYIHYTLH